MHRILLVLSLVCTSKILGQDSLLMPPCPHQNELIYALKNPSIDEYYKEILRKGRMIQSDDSKMLSVTENIFLNEPDKDFFYFLVFTKSMNGADGFYSEGLGMAAYDFITRKTDSFANYFTTSNYLTEKDLENWANSVFGEIQIAQEGHEIDAIKELNKFLLDNCANYGQESKTVILSFMEKLGSQE